MQLSDWDDILVRKAEEAPGFIPPPLTSSLPPLTSETPFEHPTQIVVSASKIPKPSVPLPPINIPKVGPIRIATMDPWDQITMRRAAMPVQTGTDWKSYIPYAIAALLAVAALTMTQRQPERKTRRVTRSSRR
jgi:hypothetical protein